MTAPIKTCDYCGATGEMPTFMNGETICYTCMSVLPKTLPEARQELVRLRALLAVVAQPAPSVPDGVSFIDTSQLAGVVSTEIVHSYPPTSGWLRAIDEALVVTHFGVANAHDTYEQAKAKLDNLIGFHVDVATDPAVNGGWKLVPIALEAKPAPSFADAYQGAMEEVAIWKKRALEAEDLNRKFIAEINGPTHMGEPAHPKPDCGEAGHDEGRCGNAQCSSDAKGE